MRISRNLLWALPVLLALAAFTPRQDPQAADKPKVTQVRFSALQYVDLAGNDRTVDARDLFELRLVEGTSQNTLLEIQYRNGDYSLIHVTQFHILRSGPAVTSDCALSRVERSEMLFPLPR